MSKRKSIKPGFDALETREVLSSFTPLMRAMPMGYGPPPPTNLPRITVHGSSPNSIGGNVGVTVEPNNQYAMTKIVYTVSGAIENDQKFNSSEGSFHTLSSKTHEPPNAVQSDSLNWYWNENSGVKNIKVAVTYNDPAHTTLTSETTVDVKKPESLGMSVDGLKYHIGSIDPAMIGKPASSEYFGITNTDANGKPGIKVNATVKNIPSAGELGFVQVVKKFDVSFLGFLWAKKRTTPEGTSLVDIPQGGSDPAMHGVWTQVNAGTGSIPVPQEFDSPTAYSEITPGIPLNKYPTSIRMSYSFTTSLVYRPIGGAYVAIDNVDWSITNTATYKTLTVPPTNKESYMDPGNWTITTDPNQDWSKIGDKKTKILTWTNNLIAGLPPFVETP